MNEGLALLRHLCRSPDLALVLLLLLAIPLVMFVVLFAGGLRQRRAFPLAILWRFAAAASEGRRKEARALAGADDSFVARVLAAGMRQLPGNLADARAAARHKVAEIVTWWNRLLWCLLVLAILSALVGVAGGLSRFGKLFKDLPRP